MRVATGFLLLTAGWEALRSGVSASLVSDSALKWNFAPEPLAWWGSHVVLRWPLVFAHLGVWGELVLGLCLFLGLLTRPAGFLAALGRCAPGDDSALRTWLRDASGEPCLFADDPEECKQGDDDEDEDGGFL